MAGALAAMVSPFVVTPGPALLFLNDKLARLELLAVSEVSDSAKILPEVTVLFREVIPSLT